MQLPCNSVSMAQTVCVLLSAADRKRLKAIASDRNRAGKYIERAESFWPRPVVGRCNMWRKRSASAAPWSGAGSSVLPRKVPTGCCVTRRASPANDRSRPIKWRTSWRSRVASRPLGPRIGPGEPWQTPPPCLCARCSASGRRTSSSRTACAVQALTDPQFAEKIADIVGLYRRSARPCRGAVDRRKEPNPGARPHPAGPADEDGPLRHDDPRLQAPWHHHVVRRIERAEGYGDRSLHAATPARGVHPLPQCRRSARCRPASWSMRSSTTTPPTSIPKVRAWLARHARWAFHFTPTSGSWLNAVESFFSTLTQATHQARRLPLHRRPPGCHQPLTSLSTNADPSPSSGPQTPTQSSPLVRTRASSVKSSH